MRSIPGQSTVWISNSAGNGYTLDTIAMKSIARFLLFLLFILVVLSGFLFTVNNTIEIPLWLGTTLPPKPLGLWVLLAFATGAMMGLLLGLGLWHRVQMKLQVRQLRQRLELAEKQLSVHRQHSGPSANKTPE